MAGFVLSALGGVVPPAGLLEVAAIVAVALLVWLVARLAVLAARLWPPSPSPVRVRSGARPQGRYASADAPGRPQPRAPGCNGFRD